MSPPPLLLAIDPGRAKCGLAVVRGPLAPGAASVCLARRVVETARLTREVAALLALWPETERILLGNATHSATLRKALAAAVPSLPIALVDEHGTSARARLRYNQENPAPGWRRLLPATMRTPEVPYDDYAALLLAEDYFSKNLDK